METTNQLIDTVPELIGTRASETPHTMAYAYRNNSGEWKTFFWSDFWAELQKIVSALQRLGLQPGDHLAILAKTSREWYLFEHAGMLAGAIIVGIDTHASRSHIQKILAETSPRILVCEKCTHDLSDAIADNTRIIQLDDQESTISKYNISTWNQLARSGLELQPHALPKVRPEDSATLIYTSGTTGDPKAIRITHRQLMVACRANMEVFPLQKNDSAICWLPMAHLYQRMMNLVAIAQGATIYIVDNHREVVRCAREVEPAIFIGVPRFFEKLHEEIQQHISQLPSLLRKFVYKAIEAAAIHQATSTSGRTLHWMKRLKYRYFDRLILRRLHTIMGSNIRFMVTGSAPIAPSLLEFFWTIGLPIYEAYGISENTIPMATNRPGEVRFGSVGKPFRQNDIRIAEDGEILVRGEGLFDGYWNDSHRNNSFTETGYYPTGDIGYFDKDGYLYLMGRKRDIFKTSTGRRIAPSHIEAIYSKSEYINHMVIVGHGHKYLVAACTLNRSAIERQLDDVSTESNFSDMYLAQDPRVKELIRKDFELYGKSLNPHEQVVKFAILPRQLSIEQGELTSNLKIRREVVENHFSQEIEQLYEKESDAGMFGRKEILL